MLFFIDRINFKFYGVVLRTGIIFQINENLYPEKSNYLINNHFILSQKNGTKA